MALARARIRKLIVEAARKGVAIISAPAGCGKTEAVFDARPHLGDIFDVVLAAEVVPAGELGRALVSTLAPRDLRNYGTLLDRSPPVSEIVTWFVRRLRNVAGTVIVDDFHRTAVDDRAAELLRGVIEGTRGRLRWIIASRTMPDFPIGSWLATGHLGMTIDEDDLRFTSAEAIALTRSLEIEIDAASLHAIIEDTGGWAIALRLSLDFWERTRSVQPLRMRTREVLFRYIESEIWGLLDSDEERTLLCAASLLNPIRLSVLKQAGFPNAADTLQRIRRVPLVTRSEDNRYRIHDILRDFALQRLNERGDLLAVVKRIGFALHDVGQDTEALNLYAEVGDHESTLEHLARNGLALLDFGRRAAVTLAIASLPRSMQKTAIISGLHGVLDESIGSFVKAEQHYREALDGDISAATRIMLARRFAVLLINRGRSKEAISVLQKALPYSVSIQEEIVLRAVMATAYAFSNAVLEAGESIEFVERNLQSLDIEPRVRAFHQLAIASLYLQNYVAADHFGRQSVEVSTQLGLHAHAARSYSVLCASILITTPQPESAAVFAQEWVTSAERGGDALLLTGAHRLKYIIAVDSGNDEAASAAEQALADLGDIRSFNDTLPARIARAMREVGKGNLARAASALVNLADQDLSSAERVLRTSMLAVIRAGQRNVDDAKALLKHPSLVAIGESGDLFARRYHNLAQAYRALALWMTDSRVTARRVISSNVELAGVAPRDQLLIQAIQAFCNTSFQAVDGKVAAEITRDLTEVGLHGFAAFLTSLCTHSESKLSPLTASELKVLRAFSNGSTEENVAEELGKSKHTVHSQMKAIIKKLDCSGRHEALEFARAQGWL